MSPTRRREDVHELSVMANALEIALDQTRRQGASRIHAITLRIGELSGVVPEALAFAFEAVVAGTPAEGARLVVETVSVLCQCPQCGEAFHPADVIYQCPCCGHISADVWRGRELELASLEVS
jgi:hydrogenase nickel incorporation protein HypA/HybF